MSRSKATPSRWPFERQLLAPAGGHLLAEWAPRTEKLVAVADGGRALADHLGFEIGNDRCDLALRQLGGRRRRLLVADLGAGHVETVFALGPGEFVEMRHRGAAGHAATDGLDQLIVVELGFAQICSLAWRQRVAGTVAGPAMAVAAGRLRLVEPLSPTDIRPRRGLRRRRQNQNQDH